MGFLFVVPLGIGLILWKKQRGAGKSLIIVLLLTGVTETVNFTLRSKGAEWFFTVHLYIFLEIALFTWMYTRLLEEQYWVWAGGGLFGLGGIALEYWGTGPSEYPAQLRNLESVFVVAVALVWFFKRLIQTPVSGVFKHNGFWTAASHLIYFTTTFIIFHMVPVITNESPAMRIKAWVFHSMMLIFLYFGYSMALLNPQSTWNNSSLSSGPAV